MLDLLLQINNFGNEIPPVIGKLSICSAPIFNRGRLIGYLSEIFRQRQMATLSKRELNRWQTSSFAVDLLR